MKDTDDGHFEFVIQIRKYSHWSSFLVLTVIVIHSGDQLWWSYNLVRSNIISTDRLFVSTLVFCQMHTLSLYDRYVPSFIFFPDFLSIVQAPTTMQNLNCSMYKFYSDIFLVSWYLLWKCSSSPPPPPIYNSICNVQCASIVTVFSCCLQRVYRTCNVFQYCIGPFLDLLFLGSHNGGCWAK